jgi:hypothetical protein
MLMLANGGACPSAWDNNISTALATDAVESAASLKEERRLGSKYPLVEDL